MIKTTLVDMRSLETELVRVIAAVGSSALVGLDCETEDSRRHAGLNVLGKYDENGFKKNKKAKLVFDMQRTTVAGFSVYPDGGDEAWYVNLGHADIENRVPWLAAKAILDTKRPAAHWVAHNAPFELTVFKNSLGYQLTNVICTLQLAVSTYGPDEYDVDTWRKAGLGEMQKFLMQIEKAGHTYEGGEFTGRLADMVSKILGKQSKAAHSYNGFCKEIAWGYGLKRAVKQHFGVDMATFEATLGDKAHMGQLTGEQVSAYGAEDAYWAVRLLHKLLAQAVTHAPKVLPTFFKQELPMTQVYADIWSDGMRINLDQVRIARTQRRKEFAETLAKLKAALKTIGAFQSAPEPRLLAREPWYEKSFGKYRDQILALANMPDSLDTFQQVYQVRSALSNAWATEQGKVESKAVNLTHYMPMRVVLYDLIGGPLVMSKGKLQSNGEARGKLKDVLQQRLAKLEGKVTADERLAQLAADHGGDDVVLEVDDEDEAAGDDMDVVDEVALERERLEAGITILSCLAKLANIEQQMKLYLTPYLHLTDPQTSRIYPSVTSQLATRRMAAQFPNPMQLSKRTDSSVRGFYIGDTDEHLIVSIDWSAIELVIIGELSGDPEFLRAFGQQPHADLHSGTAADVLAVAAEGLTEQDFLRLKLSDSWSDWNPDTDFLRRMSRAQLDLKGQLLSPQSAYKYWRTEIGKVANFSYWYSGFLAQVAERMGWTLEQAAEATERFRNRFPVAEAWRVGLIEFGRRRGYIEQPDGHRRYRYEATNRFLDDWMDKWPVENSGARAIVHKMGNRLQRRAHNQLVNCEVQGTCATVAKRSILKIKNWLEENKWTKQDARFLMPIHDELVFSVHRSRAVEFIVNARQQMITHPDLFQKSVLDASPSIGVTFQPYSAAAPLGQVELFEAPKEIFGAERAGKRLDEKGMQEAVDYLVDAQKTASRIRG